MGNLLKAHLFKQRQVGEREEVKLKLFELDGTPIDLSGGVGTPGADGADGAPGVDGVDGADGADGADGSAGPGMPNSPTKVVVSGVTGGSSQTDTITLPGPGIYSFRARGVGSNLESVISGRVLSGNPAINIAFEGIQAYFGNPAIYLQTQDGNVPINPCGFNASSAHKFKVYIPANCTFYYEYDTTPLVAFAF